VSKRTGRPASTTSRPNSDHSSSATSLDERLPTPSDSVEQLADGFVGLEREGRRSWSPELLGTVAGSLLPRTRRAQGVRSPALGTLKASVARSTGLLPFPTTADSNVDDATLRPIRRPTTSLGTIRGSTSPLAGPGPPVAGPHEDSRSSSPSAIAWPAIAPRRTRLLSATNDRFSVFVGGGIGGEDWAGQGEMATLAGERARRESGERWGDASLRSGEAAEVLRRMLGARSG
jgi:hypothetical protein